MENDGSFLHGRSFLRGQNFLRGQSLKGICYHLTTDANISGYSKDLFEVKLAHVQVSQGQKRKKHPHQCALNENENTSSSQLTTRNLWTLSAVLSGYKSLLGLLVSSWKVVLHRTIGTTRLSRWRNQRKQMMRVYPQYKCRNEQALSRVQVAKQINKTNTTQTAVIYFTGMCSHTEILLKCFPTLQIEAISTDSDLQSLWLFTHTHWGYRKK